MIRTVQHNKHIYRIEIDRPEALNAINFSAMDWLEEHVAFVENNEEIRCFILGGAGSKAFISGGDLKEFHAITDRKKAIEMASKMQELLLRIEALPCWNVAYINGNAFGGGIELLLAFDFAVSAPHARFGLTQSKFYLSPGWGGLTRLVEKVGRTKAMLWLARADILTSEEALSQNLIEHILPGEQTEIELGEWVQPLLKNGRSYIRTIKQGSSKLLPARKEALLAEVEPFASLWVDEEHIQRVQKFLSD